MYVTSRRNGRQANLYIKSNKLIKIKYYWLVRHIPLSQIAAILLIRHFLFVVTLHQHYHLKGCSEERRIIREYETHTCRRVILGNRRELLFLKLTQILSPIKWSYIERQGTCAVDITNEEISTTQKPSFTVYASQHKF